ncbi:hypothetical protein ACERIT_03650 [Halopenitus sp. H-Gu1]|uniref:hypothetical protein n=1 Tax=Halopenitus sp. H-Gu1 TaxID=3242697 RepID=UPI00359D4546
MVVELGRVLAAIVAVLGAAVLLAASANVLVPELASDAAVRIALGICGVGFVIIALAYAREGYYEQMAGHTLASAGFLVVAIDGDGPIAWLGIGLLGIGGSLLLQDAILRSGRSGTSV